MAKAILLYAVAMLICGLFGYAAGAVMIVGPLIYGVLCMMMFHKHLDRLD